MLQVVWNTAEYFVEIGTEPGVHHVVDEGVDAGVGHGQPVEEKKDVANVGLPCNGGIVVRVDEVDMIRRPANHEN